MLEQQLTLKFNCQFTVNAELSAYFWRRTHTSSPKLNPQRYAVEFTQRFHQLLDSWRRREDVRYLLVLSYLYGFVVGDCFVENHDPWFEAADTHNHHGQTPNLDVRENQGALG